jgi:hypothetical protein
MATWKMYHISEAVRDINEGKFVLPVIQRYLVWDEEKMEMLFDTLLKGDSFGGIMVIEEEKGEKPLFAFRGFTDDGTQKASSEISALDKTQYFVIDGQQRLQSFYIGLAGTMNGKNLFFDLFSNYESEYEFKFSNEEKSLPLKARNIEDRKVAEHCWYSAKKLLAELKKTNDESEVAESIIRGLNNKDETTQDLWEIKKGLINKNVAAFYRNVIAGETLGLSLVTVNKNRDEISNRQKIVELFRRLNDGGTRLAGFDLVASILKGFDWRMEAFIKDTLTEFRDICVDQDNLVKTFFLLQDNHSREMAGITANDASFAIQHRNRIRCCMLGTRRFLQHSSLYNLYRDGNTSFIPLYFIIYHLFHKQNLSDEALASCLDNYEVNPDFHKIKKWIYLSLINGIFRSRGAGWIPYRTGVRKLLEIVSANKGGEFPVDSIITMYRNHGLVFTDSIDENNIEELDRWFVFYLMYDNNQIIRQQDVDHIFPKSRLEEKYAQEQIWNICNYELIDSRTNRGNKNAMEYKQWVNTEIEDKTDYTKRHLIPTDESLWEEQNFEAFLIERGKLIVNKIHENGI